MASSVFSEFENSLYRVILFSSLIVGFGFEHGMLQRRKLILELVNLSWVKLVSEQRWTGCVYYQEDGESARVV